MIDWEHYLTLKCPYCTNMHFAPTHHETRFIEHMKKEHNHTFPEGSNTELCQPFIEKHPVPKDEQEWNKGNHNAEQWLKGKNWEYKTNHPLFNYLSGGVCEIMVKHGPDGHTDGTDLIASWILENYDIRPLESTTKRKEK